MNGKELVSIIVPIYNMQKYLERCLNSLLMQSWDNIEILCIDDGSTDGSQQICEDYAQKDSRIKVFRKINGGVSSARNFGLSRSRGENICFIDADDWLEMGMIEEMVKMLDSNNDIAVCNYFYDDVPSKALVVDGRVHRIEPKKAIEMSIIDNHGSALMAGVINKMFRRRIVKGEEFDSALAFGEDMEFLCRCIVKSNSIAYSTIPMYHYCMNDGSATHSSFNEKKMSILYASRKTGQVVSEKYPDLAEAMQIRSSACSFGFLLHALKFQYRNKMIIKEFIVDIRKSKRELLMNFDITRKLLLTWICFGYYPCILISKVMLIKEWLRQGRDDTDVK